MIRKTPLRAKTPLARSTAPMRRVPIKRFRSNGGRHIVTQFNTPPSTLRPRGSAGGIPPRIRKLLEARSHGLCEAMLEDCAVEATDAHHRKMRSQGGQHTLENLVHLCHHCHHVAIHARPRWAYEHGWLVRRDDDPAAVAISRGDRQS